ncbi:TetR/AcrR family transcriptional regulator [Planotetraspora sp. GP83]|uniref:TetR/AcrR family transcriptional regulator n=1 Tax=Planotetraspora sp. GP83 TaxID=3156264 RepID=UPI003514D259
MGRPKQFEPDVAVDKAIEVFWRKGYGSTTPQDLVEALGIGKGSLYNAFTSKHALFELALRRYGERRVATLSELLEEPGEVKPRLRVALMKLTETDPGGAYGRGCLAVNTATELAGTDQVAAKVVAGVFGQMETVLQAAIERGQRNGEIDAARDPREVASLLLGTVIGMSVLARIGDDSGRLTRMLDAVLATL